MNQDGIRDLVVTFATDQLVANGDLTMTVRTPLRVTLIATLLVHGRQAILSPGIRPKTKVNYRACPRSTEKREKLGCIRAL